MRVEPPRAGVLGGQPRRPLTTVTPTTGAPATGAPTAPSPQRWEVVAGRRLHVALVSAAAAVAATSSGDAFLLAALLGLVAADVAAAGVAALVAASLTVRYGASSLGAVAGAQGVLGPALTVGDPYSIAASVAGALALAFVSPRGLPVLAFGLAAAAVVAGPDVSGPASLAIRIGGALVGLGLTAAATRYAPRRAARWVAAGLALTSVALATAGRFIG